MLISLCYIDGISRKDTPYFDNVNEQIAYFDTKEVETVDKSFYPPYYFNEIKFDDTELDFNTQVNYVRFQYLNKWYYYFIDHITYNSESVITLSLILDDIQTYMFNITVNSGIINRKFINRWISNRINRSYLRENLSNGEFEEQNKKVIYGNYLVVVMKFRTNQTRTFIKEHTSNFEYVVPYEYKFALYDNYVTNMEAQGKNLPIRRVFYKELSKAELVDAYVIPIEFLEPYVYISNGKLYIDDTYYSTLEVTDVGHTYDYFEDVFTVKRKLDTIEGYYSELVYTKQTSLYFSSPSDISFSKNSSLNVSFSSTYMPMLFDVNYLRIYFGNLSIGAQFPLHLSNYLADFVCETKVNFDNGIISYGIYLTGDNSNKYNTFVLDSNISYYPVVTDAYLAYVAENKSRWIAATVNTGIGIGKIILGCYMNNNLVSSYANDSIGDIMSNPSNYDRRYKNPTLRKKYQREVTNIELRARKEMNSIGTQGVTSMMDNDGGIISQGFKDLNAMYAPDIVKQTGNVFDNDYIKGLFIYTQNYKVRDYEQCAQYYHRNGYKVDEYVNNIPNIFAYVKNRYYFNVLKMNSLNIHVHNILESDDIVERIEERLIDGIRLWNKDIPIGTYQYDNVELEYLE